MVCSTDASQHHILPVRRASRWIGNVSSLFPLPLFDLVLCLQFLGIAIDVRLDPPFLLGMP